jgi:hypothetical protein
MTCRVDVTSTKPGFIFTKGTKMRLIATMFAVLGACAPAAAQSWMEYAYPGYGFALSFPAEPKAETATYQAPNGHAVEAHVYSLTQDNSIFRMTVADLSDPALTETAVIGHAIKTLGQGGDVKLDIPARVSRIYGRQLSIFGADGSHTLAAVFYHKGQLYQIEARVLPPTEDFAAIRFQQSLVFTGGETNRTADAAGGNGPGGDRRQRCRDARNTAGGQNQSQGQDQGAVVAQDGPRPDGPRLDERCRRGPR